ncbi:HAMP domain-containing sensor histidine kinase [Paenibacillus woosongensis]|uniref:Heme sensor protein HssS n=1 Tax=Paenibacillus woosongensis TaxID=307580 RepID=A0AA95KTP9_9BACL|nr:HAMP domain-containing sensor histidine kinase [Paenibacillus woosongensis]WHX49088.1 HAMP domain-containing sensor histidine kinase [Paenibacillus woosongensis]
MIKSLYVRIVVMFLVAILVSLLTSTMVIGYLYQRQIQDQTQDYMITLGQSLIRIFERVGYDRRALVMDDIKDLANMVSMQVFDGSLSEEKYGSDSLIEVSREQVERVLQGETLKGTTSEGHTYVGLPFGHQGQTYAMFIEPSSNSQVGYPIGGMILTGITVLLVGGSLFFVVEAAFLIQPLRKMTEATKRMAKGDFSSELKARRKDELGVLVQSFNEMRRQLQQIEEMRQDFVSNVSHEIQSPLTSIRGFAKALKENDTLDHKNRDRYLDIIIAESERMSRMSDNLLHLASLESKHHPFHPVTFRLDEQIRQTAVALEPQWAAKSIAIDLELPVVKICGDRDQLDQVWINLLGNSIRFTPEGGKIAIDVRRGIHQVSVTIKDTGIGIAPEDQAQIFERFYKADRSRNRVYNGNGLGLAIVKRIVDLHHGHIEVRSEPGTGTEITVTLPS